MLIFSLATSFLSGGLRPNEGRTFGADRTPDFPDFVCPGELKWCSDSKAAMWSYFVVLSSQSETITRHSLRVRIVPGIDIFGETCHASYPSSRSATDILARFRGS